MRRKKFLQCVLAVLPALKATIDQTIMTISPNALTLIQRAIIQKAKQAWLDGEANKFADLFAKTGEFVVPGQKWRGHSAILSAFQEFSATHAVESITIRNVITQENHAMVEWSWQERDLQTGKISTAEDAIAIDFQGNYIQWWREYIDKDSAS